MSIKLTSTYLTAKGGMTASKADFLANVIKQICMNTESTLNGHTIVQKVLTDQNGQKLDYVQVSPELSQQDIVELATSEGRYYAVSAWLREGIKAKDAILNNIRYASAADFDITLPVLSDYLKNVVNPATIIIPNEDDLSLVIERLNVNERAEYLTFEAQAAWIGKRIHGTNALFNNWRKIAVGFKPVEFLTPVPTQVYTLTNTLRLSVEQIDSVLLNLQGLHRNFESKLNGFKARLKSEIHSLIQEAQNKRIAAEVDFRAAHDSYASDQRAKLAEVEKVRSEYLVKASKLNIVVPDMHKAILEEVEKSTNLNELTK